MGIADFAAFCGFSAAFGGFGPLRGFSAHPTAVNFLQNSTVRSGRRQTQVAELNIGGFLRYRIDVDEVIGDAMGNYNDDDFDPDEDFI